MDLAFGSYGFEVAVYVIGIMIAVAGISLGLGYTLNNKSIKEFGKEELLQCVINGIIVGSLIALFSSNGVVTGLINSLTLSNGVSISCNAYLDSNAAICFAYDYLAGSGYTLAGTYHQSILGSATGMMLALLSLNAVLGILGSVSINLSIITLSLTSVVNPLISQVQYFIKALNFVIVGALVQSSVLAFISVSTLTVILPVGIILRSFYPSRKLGGFLMAMAIGLYVVLPLSYVFDATIANSYMVDVNSTSIIQVTSGANGVQAGLLNFPQYNSKQPGIVTAFVASITNAAESVVTGFSNIVNWIFDALSYFIVYTFILPSFSLIITGVSIRELSELLGSEAHFGMFDML